MGAMDWDLATGRWTTRARRRGLTLLLAALTAALGMAIAVPAQAHEPWVAKAWGENASGQLGNGTNAGPEKCGTTMAPCSASPVAVSELSGVSAVSGGESYSLALLEGGGVEAWGANGSGQLGNGTTTDSHVPVKVTGLSEVTAIAAGSHFSVALRSDGTVVAWGANGAGQLGNGTTTDSHVPVKVTGLSEVTAIAAGGEFVLALLKNGTVMGWGADYEGQLGNGTTGKSTGPVAVCALGEKAPCAKHLEGVVAIAAGQEHGVAVLASGGALSWGSNRDGQLGNGSEAKSETPVTVSGLSQVASVAAWGLNNLALLETGKVMAWGLNLYGEDGDGTSTGPEGCGTFMLACAKKPVEVTGVSTASAVASGRQHSLALLKDGTVLSWGENAFGQLGTGSSMGPGLCPAVEPTPCSETRVEVSKLRAIKGIAGGGRHSLAFGPPPPGVTGITPNEPRKKGATSVTITGADFEEATAVKFGENNAMSFTVNSEGSITAFAPAGKGLVDVTVTTPAGTSPTSAADQFYYERPTVKKVSPKKGPASGGTSVTITGVNFTGATAVKFGANNATGVTVNSDSSITCVSPAGSAKTAVDVTVTTSNGTSATSKKDRFKYQ
jgi:alpha-tubulin suppressor-like RCC1 family protein